MAPWESNASVPASTTAAIAASRSAPEPGRAARSLRAVAVDDTT
jgi:hypothetical protein